jgi:hypothetical protein
VEEVLQSAGGDLGVVPTVQEEVEQSLGDTEAEQNDSN